MDNEYSIKLSNPIYSDLGDDQKLTPIFDDQSEQTLEVWAEKKKELINRWYTVIGQPSFTDYSKEIEILDSYTQPGYRGTLIRQTTGPKSKQLLLLMEPLTSECNQKPGAVVPFYHPDSMAGFDLNERKSIEKDKTIQFGLHLVRQGYVVVCTEAFPYNTVTEPTDDRGFARWQAAADKIKREQPSWTGIGKLIWDTRRAVDFLLSQRDIDENRIVAIGHSLGGKMAFCTGAFDDRIKAVIASDFGIGWDFTNWDADWYFGKQIHQKDFVCGLQQLLAIMAPRSFLLIGRLYDRPASWQYINEAKKVYRLYGKEYALGFIDHASGHRPPTEAMITAYRWLSEQFNLQYRNFEF